MTMTKDLQAISNELTKLAKQTEQLVFAIGKSKKPRVKSTKTQTKAKAVIKKVMANLRDKINGLLG